MSLGPNFIVLSEIMYAYFLHFSYIQDIAEFSFNYKLLISQQANSVFQELSPNVITNII